MADTALPRAFAVFRRPFPEQVAAFRLRLGDLRPTRAWTDLWQAEHDRAFMVAGALKADLLADLAAAVQSAIEEGTGIERFRAEFREIVERRGWHGWTGEGSKRGEAWRTRVIYKTNMQTTFAAGRWAQLKQAGFPLLIYRHGGSLEPRLQHLGWDGLILPADHPFWQTHAPPNGWGCSCYVIGARSMRDAVRKGGKPGKTLPDGWAVRSPKTGAPPGIDKGWAYAPGASVAETIAQVAAKLPGLPGLLAGDLGRDLPAQVPPAPPPQPAPQPAPPPVPEFLAWTDWPRVRTLEDVRRAAVAAGVAENVSLRSSLPMAGVNAYLRQGAEITQRFGLPKLRHFAEASDLPFRVRGARRAAAFYVASMQSMGVKAKGVSPSQVKALFDLDEAPSTVARWHDELARASSEVRDRATRMAPRRWSVVREVRDIASHEWGHHLHYSWRREVDDLIDRHAMIADGWPKLISRYAGTNREEFIAESFALYMRGDATQFFRLHPELLAYFQRKDRQT
ncbi:MAG: hypothetical protein KF887_07075 [Paracoccaceae bacterium]|nr:MAG: hypothetical protein KF887_07075 [Paracoccaceae bacterium]